MQSARQSLKIAAVAMSLWFAPGCTTARSPRIGEPLAVIYVSRSDVINRPQFAGLGLGAPSLALYDDGTVLRRRVVDDALMVVRARLSRVDASELARTVGRCMAALPDRLVLTDEPHAPSMRLRLRLSGTSRQWEFVGVSEIQGRPMIIESAEYQAAVYGTAPPRSSPTTSAPSGAAVIDLTPRPTAEPIVAPPAWACLRPLLDLEVRREHRWTPPIINLTLAHPRSHPRTGEPWPASLPPPTPPSEVRGDTRLRVDLPFAHAATIDTLLRAGGQVRLFDHVWTIETAVPWPGE